MRLALVLTSAALTMALLPVPAGTPLLAAEPHELLPAVDDRWLHCTSPNFELFTRNGAREARDLLYNLELIRAVFLDRFKFTERSRREVTVYSFRSRKDFKAYSPDALAKRSRLAGFYHPSPDRAVIALAPADSSDDAQRVVFHEYIHHLFTSAEAAPATWFSEGAAELYAGMRVEDGKLQIGHPLTGRLFNIRREKLLSLDTLFHVTPGSVLYRSSDHTGLFYAQSWALLHYWTCGESGLDAASVARFLDVAADAKAVAAVNLREHFQACFGMDYPEMLKRLERYVHSGRYRHRTEPLPDIPGPESYEVTPVAQDVIRVRLAELAVRVNRSAAGQLILRQATFFMPSDPRPFEALGAYAWTEGDRDEAIAQWNRAVEAGTRNVAIFRELAQAECREWFRDFDYDLRIPEGSAALLRERLLQSIAHEPEQSAAYESLAWVEAFADDRKIANVNLVQERFRRLGDQARTAVALAMVRVRLGKPNEALRLLKSIKALQPDEWTAQAAEVMMARLEGRPVQRITVSQRAVENEESALYAPRVPNEMRVLSVPLPEDL